MQTKVQMWGNSLAIRIPKSFAMEMGLAQDISVDLSFEEGRSGNCTFAGGCIYFGGIARRDYRRKYAQRDREWTCCGQ